MSEVLFNTHDLVLISTILICLVHTLNFISLRNKNKYFYFSSALFFICSATIPLDTLINFGAAFHPWVVEHAPQLIYLFEFGIWLQAPFAYLLIASMLDKDFRVTPVHALLFVPFALHTLHQLTLYHTLSTEVKVSKQVLSNQVDPSVSVFFVQLSRELFRSVLAVICYRVVIHYRQHLHSTTRGWPDVFCLFLMTSAGLSAVIAVMLLVQAQTDLAMPVPFVGLSQNYITLGLLIALLVTYTKDALAHHDFQATHLHKMHDAVHTVNPEYIEIIEDLMQREKIYKDTGLSLETMAKRINISPRTLSAAINGHYHCNFGEFINRARLEEAKRLLITQQTRSILDVMYSSGFNSKATFNGVFKRVEGLTPSEYRKQSAAA